MSLLNKDLVPFWMDEPTILYKNENYLNFFPKQETSNVEKLNSITRMCIYLIILMVSFQQNEKWLYIPIVTIVMVVILYNIESKDSKSNQKRVTKILNNRKDKIIEKKKIAALKSKKYNNFIDADIDLKNIIDDNDTDIRNNIDVGVMDSSGDINFTSMAPTSITSPMSIDNTAENEQVDNQELYNDEEIEEFESNTCRKPTQSNPFMNPSVVEFGDGDIPTACNADDEDINDNVNENFNKDLFRNIDDLWDKTNSQRQFYTVPNTSNPNDQQGFAEWCYKTDNTCKEDQEGCLKYEDLRYKRSLTN